MTEKPFTVEFTRSEAEILVKLIDLAVKSAGMSVAANAVFFHNKLDQAYKDSLVSKALADSPAPEKEGTS